MSDDSARQPKPASAHTAAANTAVRNDPDLDFGDTTDRANAVRGFIAKIEPPVIAAEGRDRPAWDLNDYAFLADGVDDDAPDTVNPSLWRQARLNMEHGLFRIHDRILQVRGYDLSVMSVIEGDTGYLVIDPLISKETAAASMQLVREHCGDKPVHAVIYTHSHVDHFGGVHGIVSSDDVAAGRCAILAPEGFMHAAISENVYAGNAMTRRAIYMYGALLERGPQGQVDAGLGKTTSNGSIGLIPPTDDICATGETRTIDGVEIEFHLTPGTEAPAEMNFYFPQFRALCMAENCSHNLHNLYTLRGAQVRDALAWATYLDEAILRFGERSDVVFASHHWPVWGVEAGTRYLTQQRDMYKFLHDQTLRQANRGLTMNECAEVIRLPENLRREWHARGYYGSVNHDVKAVYQRYLGFFDANPAHLHPLPPEDAAVRYVEWMGGADAVIAKARESFAAGDYRWTAEVLNHVVFADPDNTEARLLQADVLEQMGYQAESGPWRNFYLCGAKELRDGVAADQTPITAPSEMAHALTVELLAGAMAVRLKAEEAEGETFGINLDLTDIGEQHCVWVENCVLHHREAHRDDAALTMRLTKSALIALLVERKPPFELGIEFVGDPMPLVKLAQMIDEPEFWFNIVTP